MNSEQPVNPTSSATAYSEGFLNAVRRVIESLGGSVEGFRGGYLIAGFSGRRHGLGLDNLYRAWGGASPDEGEQLIRNHLARAQNALLDSARRQEEERDFAHVLDRLMPRVGQAFSDVGFQNRVVARRLTSDGLFLNFVIDYPETVTYVEKRFLDDWGVTAQDLRRVALANLRKRTRTALFQPLEPGKPLYAYESRDTYDAARLLLLDELMPEARKLGFIAAVPGRDLLLAYPLSPRRLTDLHQLVQISRHFHSKLTYAVSNQVYWVRDGRISHIPSLIESGKVIVVPPDDMVQALREDA